MTTLERPCWVLHYPSGHTSENHWPTREAAATHCHDGCTPAGTTIGQRAQPCLIITCATPGCSSYIDHDYGSAYHHTNMADARICATIHNWTADPSDHFYCLTCSRRRYPIGTALQAEPPTTGGPGDRHAVLLAPPAYGEELQSLCGALVHPPGRPCDVDTVTCPACHLILADSDPGQRLETAAAPRSLKTGIRAFTDAIRGRFPVECGACEGRSCADCHDGVILTGFAWTRPLWDKDSRRA
ncbi:hypothetical protein [Nonomuraea sp. NPDC023979]|uniref:hypothetical protein n=1 Tax=Nonomuraea sp. NPDC023979 TaxID=3154796 RepID=UPI0033D557D4